MATVPPAPDPIGFFSVTATAITYRFSSNGNGGLPILEWQIGYGTSSAALQKTIKSSGTTTISGLKPATTYYFWARGRNKVGWGPWSVRTSRRTPAGARVKIGATWKEAIPYVRVKGKWVIAQPYVRVSGIWRKTG
jgi:hypothetical protein